MGINKFFIGLLFCFGMESIEASLIAQEPEDTPRIGQVREMRQKFENIALAQNELLESSSSSLSAVESSREEETDEGSREEMPSILELFSVDEEYGVNLEVARKRQMLIRQDGTLSLDDPATHIVNLYGIKDVTYPKAKQLRSSVDGKLNKLKIALKENERELKALELCEKHICQTQGKLRKKKKFYNGVRYKVSREKQLLFQQQLDIENDLKLTMMYHPDRIRKDAYRIVQRILDDAPTKAIRKKVRSVMKEFK